ncbi:MAG TPA: diguanylate cyclase, partial [Acidimicrobiales bacterium]|nr:diguanylate cyclase [Acidimicrobiales bacterium]
MESSGRRRGGGEVPDLSEEALESERLVRLRRLYSVLVETSEAILRATTEIELLRAACRIAVDQGGFRMAWAGLVDESAGVVRNVASSGVADGYADSLRITLRDEPEGRGPVGMAARTGRPSWINELKREVDSEPWRSRALSHGYESIGAFPVLVDDRPVAVIAVYSSEPRFFNEQEVQLMCRLVSNVAFGWAGIVRDEQRRRSEAARRGSERLFRHGFDQAAVGLALVDEDGLFSQVNPALCQMLGREREQLLGAPVSAIIHPEDRREHRWDQEALGSSSTLSSQFEERFRRADGSMIWAIVLRSRVIDPAGRPRYYAQFIDITVHRLAEQELRRHAAQQAAVAALGRRALSSVDLADLFAEATEMVVDALGVEMSSVFELVDPSGAVMRGGCGLPDDFRPEVRIAIGPETLAGYALRTRQPVVVNDFGSETRFVAEFINSVMGIAACLTVEIRVADAPFGFLGAACRTPHSFTEDDVHFFEAVANVLAAAIERRHGEQEVRRQALHDSLTGLPNRTLLLDRLEQGLARLRRRDGVLAVLFADLDRFKVINDSLGHGFGDRLLIALAVRLRATLRPGDTVARLGGDEFVVLCDDLVCAEDALATARRMASALDRPFEIDGQEVFLTMSTGVTVVSSDEADGAVADSLLRDADLAMYQAKANGRARWEVFNSAMRAGVVHRVATESALRRAVERLELRTEYQPIMTVTGRLIVGAEALVRWQHPEEGIVAPERFIPVAEESGLIVPVGRWVLEEACRQGAKWADAYDWGPDNFFVSVNLSARQLSHPGLVEDVREALQLSRLHPASLCLEVTETAVMEDVR